MKKDGLSLDARRTTTSYIPINTKTHSLRKLLQFEFPKVNPLSSRIQ